ENAPHSQLSGASGSDGGSSFHVDYSAPLSKHFGFILSHGRTFSQGFRNFIGGGSEAPGSTYATFGEIVNKFARGSIDLFGYSASGTQMRPNLVPVSPLQNYDASGNPIAGSYVTANGFDLNGNPNPGQTYSQQTSGFYSALPLDVWQKTDSNSTRLAAVDLEYGLQHGWSLSNILAYRHGDRLHVKDFNFDRSNNSGRYELNNPFSNALSEKVTLHHVNARNGDALDIGAETFGSLYNTRNAFYNSDPVESAPSAPSFVTQPSVYRNNYFQQKNLALYGQYLVRLGSRWKVTPGIRYVSLATNFLNSGFEGFPQCIGVPAASGICSNKTKLGNSGTVFNGIEPSAAIQYLADPNLSIYGNFGRALRSPQTSPGGPYQNIAVAGISPEIGTNSEVGVKYFRRLPGRMLDGSPQQAFLTASLFSERVVGQYIPISIGAGVKVASATGSSKYSGLTLAFDRTIGRSFELFGGLSTTHAFFDSYDYLGTNYSGLPVTQVPKYAYNLGFSAQKLVGSSVLTGRLWDSFTGPQAMWNNLLGQPDPNGLQIPSYALMNASVGYQSSTVGHPLAVTLSFSNLFNTRYNVFEYVTSGAYFGGGVGQSNLAGPGALLADPGAPREVQLSFSVRT
ncbi:MAG TPA: TonB-dependent receptor, partial [Candidatus Dormibacteraeota bacterium]|nr:TonB-dependent receptor [Candidatus Dormibacteraeota bacterium]